MQFHHNGYVSHDPRELAAAGYGIDRPIELPEKMDVLIVGSGPAGMVTAAQLAMFADINTRIIESRPHRLELGQADGIQSRSVETFQAFGFAKEIEEEAYEITEMAFWNPDPENRNHIKRGATPVDDESGISEFPHLIVNQARVLDYFARFARRGPARITPDYGWSFISLEVGEGEYPVKAVVEDGNGNTRELEAKYVVGCDGARSQVRKSIGGKLQGDQANHAWGVMDVVVDTDFPDWRTKCAIHSRAGSILHIPREGGYLCRVYVDLGVVPAGDGGAIRSTPIERIIEKANEIYSPYFIDVKMVAWHSVYEVGHRLVESFADDGDSPRVFLTGDACHTHSAKAGQGMNVSMQDGFNLGWKLGHVLSGRAPEQLLCTYHLERQPAALNLINFDRKWSTLMATPPEELEDPGAVEKFYVAAEEFAAGMMTEYEANMVVGDRRHQDLATGYPVGKRFKSFEVLRRCDAYPLHLGHQHSADGRYRIYAFADSAAPADPSAMDSWAEQVGDILASYTPQGLDENAFFDVKAIYQTTDHRQYSVLDAPRLFRPVNGSLQVPNWENVFNALPGEGDIFQARGISREGAVVIVRPDQYVGAVLRLDEPAAVDEYFSRALFKR
ncbi:FAD-dependent monooxygenase [Corynebacterium flavescens]|uniref:FAD-dependent monooxygenase n=1 Tax=Corynebacterium flavescens TaxID=28028 RepID=UPI0026471C2F|nr:FAD-dependent monooxygenase [Corynebacterium flavescens]MDN6225882.1 FAD-dependent monooxygenase [Corynebacterium flavescens]